MAQIPKIDFLASRKLQVKRLLKSSGRRKKLIKTCYAFSECCMRDNNNKPKFVLIKDRLRNLKVISVCAM